MIAHDDSPDCASPILSELLMKTLFASLAFLVILVSSAASQWKHAEGNLPSYGTLLALDATDSLTAVAAFTAPAGIAHNYPVYKTVDGGGSWRELNTPGTNYDNPTTDIAMTDSSHIWFVTSNGKIYSTSNGGSAWTLQYCDTSITKYIDYIEMFNANEGVAMADAPSAGKPAVFLHTSNGGTVWTPVLPTGFEGEHSGDDWRRIDFVDKNVGYFYASKLGVPYKTTDGGATWKAVPFPQKIMAQSLNFYNASIGLAAVYMGADRIAPWLYRTTDGGASWKFLKVTDDKGWGNDIEFVPGDPSKVWYTSYEGMFFSSDTGSTWVKQSFDSASVKGRDIKLVAGNIGWFGCDSKAVYRTTQSAVVFNLQTSVNRSAQALPASFALNQNFPNPFNPSTTISFALPARSHVTLDIFDLMGRHVASILSEELSAGLHSRQWNAAGFPSGMYFYRLQAGAYTETKRLLLLR
jgi:hypothetical protein